ncbi:unnamed protein product, partial [Pylaiella littoralis]
FQPNPDRPSQPHHRSSYAPTIDLALGKTPSSCPTDIGRPWLPSSTMKGFHGLLVIGLGLLWDPQLGDAQTCSDGVTVGVDGNGVVCCTTGCTTCGGGSCGSAGAAAGLDSSDCCGSNIKASGVFCRNGDNPAPCILGGESTCSDGVTLGVDGNGVVCCPLGCSTCGGPGCGAAGDDCCGGPIKASGVFCGDGTNPAPCILGSAPTPTPDVPPTCSDGITVGVDGNGVVCCPSGCSQCGGPGCTTAGTDCCGGPITASGVFCGMGTNPAPCILGDPPAPAPVAPFTPPVPTPVSGSLCADDLTVGVGSG